MRESVFHYFNSRAGELSHFIVGIQVWVWLPKHLLLVVWYFLYVSIGPDWCAIVDVAGALLWELGSLTGCGAIWIGWALLTSGIDTLGIQY